VLVPIGKCRQFRPEDARICSEILRANVQGDTDYPPDLRKVMLTAEVPDLMLERAALYYVAVCESDLGVVGVGGLELNEIRFLAVLPSCQRLGIGRSVLEHLEAMVPPALFKDIFVYASPGAEGFYRACGYHAGGGETLEVHGHLVPTIFMTRRL
jgi:GNAT superfamily N-acetyltransferase